MALGNGHGTFQPAIGYYSGHSGYYGVLADMNGDGYLDAVISGADNYVSILLGRGDGSFSEPNSYSSLSSGPMRVADVNNDGILDVVLGSVVYGQTVVVLPGKGDGSLQPAQPSGSRPVADIQLTDVNGDGRLDVVAVTNRDNGSDVLVLAGDGTGNFVPRDTYAECSEPFQILATDVNGDGKPDLIIGNSALEVLINTTK